MLRIGMAFTPGLRLELFRTRETMIRVSSAPQEYHRLLVREIGWKPILDESFRF
jgi:hypothetical protein